MLLNKQVCCKCVKGKRGKGIYNSSDKQFKENWDRGLLWCPRQATWFDILMKNVKEPWCERCEYILEHIVNVSE